MRKDQPIAYLGRTSNHLVKVISLWRMRILKYLMVWRLAPYCPTLSNSSCFLFVQRTVPTFANHPWSWHILTHLDQFNPVTAKAKRYSWRGPKTLSSFGDELRPWNLDHFRIRFEPGAAWDWLTNAIQCQKTQANQLFTVKNEQSSSLAKDSLGILSHFCDCATWNHCRLGKSRYHKWIDGFHL